MIDQLRKTVKQTSTRDFSQYDPFLRGPFPVGVRTIETHDPSRDRIFPCEIWYPAAAEHAGQDLAPETRDNFTVPPRGPKRHQTAVRNADGQRGRYPLIVFSHASGAGRRSATFLCTHLASHGYVVAALDHSEVVVPELGRKEAEPYEERTARWEKVIASRVPDMCFLLDHVLKNWNPEAQLDPDQIGIVGHSFGGWTALATPDVEPRIGAAVALAPGGASNPKPGILPVTLAFNWRRDLPTLYLVADNDTSLPLTGMYELFQRTPEPKQMIILRRADHLHFMDHVEELHEAFRTMTLSAELAAIQKEMRPITELCSGEQAHLFVRGLTLAHFDANLKDRPEAKQLLTGDVEAELSRRSVAATAHKS